MTKQIAVSPGSPDREPVQAEPEAAAVSDGTPEGAGASPGVRGQVKPVTRWAGAKRWLAPYVADPIYRYLTTRGGRYCEPFLGGGAVALAVLSRETDVRNLGGLGSPSAPMAFLSDACAPLIQMFRSVVANPDRVYAEMRELAIRGVDEDTYYEERRKAATPGRFLYLNALCFNGLYRENASGQNNVPFGDRGEDPFPSREAIHAVAGVLKGASIQTWDFRRALRNVKQGDFVYIDPPYAGGFANYTRNGFTDDDQQELAAMLENLAASGVAIVACNADTPAVRAWYSWAPHVVDTGERRAINRDGAARSKKASCLLITTDPALLGELA